MGMHMISKTGFGDQVILSHLGKISRLSYNFKVRKIDEFWYHRKIRQGFFK